MKMYSNYRVIYSFLLLLSILGHANAQTPQWGHSFGDPSGSQEIIDIDIDYNGNTYVIGNFTGTVDFGPTGNHDHTSAGATDVFIAKYDPSGAFLWVTRFGGINGDKGLAISVDKESSNEVIITGSFEGSGATFEIDGPISTGPTLNSNANSRDIFIAKLNPLSGSVMWANAYGAAGIDEGTGVATTPAGDIYVVGYLDGIVDFGCGPPSSPGQRDGFITKLNIATGACIWTETVGGNLDDQINDVYIASGTFEPVVVGEFASTNFSPFTLSSNGSTDIFIIKYNQSGGTVWGQDYGDVGTDKGLSIALNPAGEVFVTGEFQNAVDFSPTGGTVLSAPGTTDAFLAKYDPNGGTLLWANQLNGSGSTNGWSVAVNNSSVFLTGAYTGNIDLDPSAGVFNLGAIGPTDGFIAKYTSGVGGFVWGVDIGNTGNSVTDISYAVALDTFGHITIGGTFSDMIDFDPGPTAFNLNSAGSTDAFLVQYCDPPTVAALTLPSGPFCDGESFTLDALNGGVPPFTYQWSTGATTGSVNEVAVGSGANTTVTYTLTLTDGNGCSNIDSVDVEINDVIAAPFGTSSCSGGSVNLNPITNGNVFNWSTGATTSNITVSPSVTTNYTVTITNSTTGCVKSFTDSVVVGTAPNISPFTTSPTGQACPNELYTVDANCSGAGCLGASYSWSNGETTQNFTISESNNTGYCSSYNVTATASSGCTATGAAAFCIAVGPDTSISVFPSTTICEGQQLDLISNCGSCASYTWSENDTLPLGPFIGTNNVEFVTPTAGSYDYYVSVTQGGCTGVNSVSVTVNPSPTATIAVSPSATICEGETVNLSNSCIGCSGSESYSWAFGFAPTTNLLLSTTSTESHAPVASTNYYVTVTDNGCSALDSVFVTVNPSPTTSIAVTPGTTICVGDSVNLSNSCGSCITPSYSWTLGPPPSGIQFSTSSTATNTPISNTYYYVSVTENGCSTLDSVDVTVNPSPTVTMPSLGATCTNSSITVTPSYAGGSGGNTYLWDDLSNGLGKTFTGPATPTTLTHRVTVTDLNGCFDIDSTNQSIVDCGNASLFSTIDLASPVCYGATPQIAVIDAPNGSTYLWNTGETAQFINPTLTTNTSFSVTVSFGGSPISTLNTGLIEVLPASINITAPTTTLCNGITSIPIDMTPYPLISYPTNIYKDGVLIGGGSGIFSHNATSPGVYHFEMKSCPVISNIITITESNISPHITAVPSGTLCQGDSVALIATGNCSGGCDYNWSTSSTSNYISTLTGGAYTVSITESSTGCTADTTVNINQINNVITGFNAGVPMQSSEPPRDLATLVTYNPGPPVTDLFSGSGISGTQFDPSVAGVGSHIITYSYVDNGCTFSITDTIVVSDTSTTVVYNNLNPVSGAYSSSEVCLGDSLEVTFSIPDPGVTCGLVTLHFNDGQGGSIVGTSGTTTCYVSNGNLIITTQAIVPNGAKTGIVKAFVPTISDTTSLTAIIVNNPTVQLVGTKNPLCSNDSMVITAIPAGGVFSTNYLSGPNGSSPMVGNTVYGNLVSPFLNGIRDLNISYSYTPSYGNGAGNACSLPIIVDSATTIHNIELNDIVFFDVAVSETNVLIDSLVNYVLPDTAQFFTQTFGGLGVLGVGPYNFNPSAVGVGSHPINYQISNGVGCSNNITRNINVIAAPNWLGLNTQYCNNATIDSLERDPAYIYSTATPPGLHITNNAIEIIATNYPGGTLPAVTPLPPSPNDYEYLFDPTLVTGAFSVITINYRYIERSGGPTGPIIRSYIRGSVSDTIFIGSGSTVQFIDIDSFYCEQNAYQRILVSPAGGQLNIVGGSSNIIETPNSLGEIYINPYNIHNNETSTTTYTFTYQYGLTGCTNSVDTQVIIPVPANDSFYTSSGNVGHEYCKSDAKDSLIAINPNGAFTIDGFPVANKFNPAILPAGPHLVRYTIPNNFGCLSERVDTFRVHALPIINFDTILASTYCEYTTPITITANQIPIPPLTTSSWTLNTISGTTVATLANSNVFTLTPSTFDTDTLPDSIQVIYSYTDAKGCIGSRLSNVIINPKPNVNITNLEPVYCINNAAVGLNPTPSGGIFSSDLGASSTNFNSTTGVYNPISTISQEFISYIYTSPTTGCIDTLLDTTSVISVSQTVNITSGLPPSYCFIGDTLSISASPAPGPGESATFSSTAISANGGIVDIQGTTAYYVPNQGSDGNIIVTYVFTTTSGCAKTASDTILIHPLPDLVMQVGSTVPGLDTICRYYDSEPINIINNGSYLPIGAPNLSVIGTGVSGQYFYPDSVLAGTYQIAMSYTDVNGCSNSAIDSIVVLPNDYPYVSGLNSLYCQNASADTIFASPTGGTWTPSASYLLTPSGQPYSIFDPNTYFNTVGTGQDSISYSYTYVNGCSNTTVSNYTVANTPNIAIVSPTQTTICTGDSMVLLQATLNGNLIPTDTIGSFFVLDPALAPAPAAIAQDSMFDPSVGTGVYTINYAFDDAASGCSDTVSQTMTINPSPIFNMVGFKQNYCIGDAPDTIGITAVSGLVSITYSITGDTGVYAIGGTNNAFLHPDSIGVNIGQSDTLQVTVFNGCSTTNEYEVTVSGLPTGLYLAGVDPYYCTNTTKDIISGYPNGGLSSGFRVYDSLDVLIDQSLNDQISLRPLNYGLGAYKVVYRYEDAFSCASEDSAFFEIHPAPVADYQQLSFCKGDSIQIENRSYFPSVLNASDTLVSWKWIYKGLSFGHNQDDTLTIYNEQPGWGHIALEVVSGVGCRDTLSSSFDNGSGQRGDTVFVYTIPTANFITIGGCEDSEITLVPGDMNITPTFLGVPLDQVSQAQWFFDDGNDSTILNPGNTLDTITHTYSQAGIYYPRLMINNNANCGANDSVRLVISPRINPYPTAYSQNFETTNTDWAQSVDGVDSLWQWGVAGGTWISTMGDTAHNKLWVTALDSFYPPGAASWVYSPCFDFTNSLRPMIKMDFMADIYDSDGAVLEYYVDSSNTWETVGEQDQGINWYNNPGVVGFINFKPLGAGVSLEGWSGVKGQWNTGRYRLDEFKGKKDIRFRLAFGSLSGVTGEWDGFAFDNVWVGERTHNVLIEHFANVHHLNMNKVNTGLYDLILNPHNGLDVYFIQYHTDRLVADEINLDNTGDHNSRRFYYGVENADGLIDGGAIYKGLTKNITQEMLDYSMLQDPVFVIDDIVLNIDVNANEVSVSTNVVAQKDLPLRKYAIRTVVVEDSLIRTTNDIFAKQLLMHSVMRKMLPSHSGVQKTQAWTTGQSEPIQQLWSSVDFSKYNKNHLSAAVFIQDDDGSTNGSTASFEVYQVKTSRDINYLNTIGVQEQEEAETLKELFSAKVYPNPAMDEFTVGFSKALQHDYEWQLIDMRGVRLQHGAIHKGDEQLQVLSNNLPAGMYLINVYNKEESIWIQRKVVIVRP